MTHRKLSNPAPGDAWEARRRGFRWRVPPWFNIADACCGRWARSPVTAARTAVRWEAEAGGAGTLSFGELLAAAPELAPYAEGLEEILHGDTMLKLLPGGRWRVS